MARAADRSGLGRARRTWSARAIQSSSPAYFRERVFEAEGGERKTFESFVVEDLKVLRRRRATEVA